MSFIERLFLLCPLFRGSSCQSTIRGSIVQCACVNDMFDKIFSSLCDLTSRNNRFVLIIISCEIWTTTCTT